MVRIKYTAQNPPVEGNLRHYTAAEFKRVELAMSVLVQLLSSPDLQVPIEVGPANSAGVGYRALRIPN